ncbi:MAG: hypothetical protein WD824_06825 [Cyclobacteriaceae bacterium]
MIQVLRWLQFVPATHKSSHYPKYPKLSSIPEGFMNTKIPEKETRVREKAGPKNPHEETTHFSLWC